jgi:protein TonB
MAISIVAHALVLLITFKPPEVPAGKFTPQLDVVLVNTKSASRPANAELLAQANVDGGGNVETDRRAKTNLPAVRDMEPAATVQLPARRVEQLEQEARRLLALAQTQGAVAPHRDPQRSEAAPERPRDPALDERELMIARLEAEIAREWEAYQKLPRRKFIGARAEGVVYAEYVDKWRRRIEQVGTENFPDEARRKQIYGSLLLTVSIKADGSVEKVEIERSSGHRVLDSAATRIVDLAGPFSPFPDAIRAHYDVLSITRNWSFTRTDLELAVSP